MLDRHEQVSTDRLQVFEWGGWHKFLITHAAPGSQRVEVSPGAMLCSHADRSRPAMVHVNLSRPQTIFPDYEDWLRVYEDAGRPVLNGYCDSLDKWATQSACAKAGILEVRATPEGDPEETLLIKSRANHRGLHEGLLPSEVAGDMAPPDWPYPERVHTLKRKEIPDRIWANRQLTVERYITNSADRFHRAYVVGEYVAVATSVSTKLVKEMSHEHGVELVSTPSAASLPLDNKEPISVAFALAEAMRVDFAALDLAIDDQGFVYAIDLNTTPHWGESADLNARLINEMRGAFESLTQSGSRFA